MILYDYQKCDDEENPLTLRRSTVTLQEAEYVLDSYMSLFSELANSILALKINNESLLASVSTKINKINSEYAENVGITTKLVASDSVIPKVKKSTKSKSKKIKE